MSKKITLDCNKLRRVQVTRLVDKEEWNQHQGEILKGMAMQITAGLIKENLIRFTTAPFDTRIGQIKVIEEIMVVVPSQIK